MVISIEKDKFGEIEENGQCKDVIRFTLNNGYMVVQIITYGATITSLKVPGKHDKLDDIVLGFDDLNSYINHAHYFGSTVGRCANRIARAKFTLNGETYNLAANNGVNHLHGGLKGFDKINWDWKIEENKVVFSYTSPSMEENYPGDLECKVTYELKEENELLIQFEAKTNKATPVNMTNHSYFNLAGHGNGTVYDHVVSINADAYTPVDDSLIPTGEIVLVESSSFDLRQPKQLGALFKTLEDGFDHNFCVNGSAGKERKVARVYHPESERVMEVFSNQPGVQFYTSNCIPEDDTLKGKSGRLYRKHGALCLETQNYPDAINQKSFPSVILEKDEIYIHTARFCFSTERNTMKKE